MSLPTSTSGEDGSAVPSSTSLDAFGVALPFELTQLFEPMECKLCHVKGTSAASAYAHYEGKAHCKNVNKFLQENYNITHQYKKVKSDFQPTTCETCCVTLSSEIQAQLHFNGKTHARNLKNPGNAWSVILESSRIEEATSSTNVESSGNGEDTHVNHAAGETSEHEVNDVTEVEKEAADEDWPYCELCDIYCNTEAQMEVHKTGSRHLKSVAYYSKLVKKEVSQKKVSVSSSNSLNQLQSNQESAHASATPTSSINDCNNSNQQTSEYTTFPNYYMPYPPNLQPIMDDPVTTLAKALTSLVSGALGQCQTNYYQPTLYDPRTLMFNQQLQTQGVGPFPLYSNNYYECPKGQGFLNTNKLQLSHIQPWLPYYKNDSGQYQCLPCNNSSKTPEKFVEHLNSQKHNQSMIQYIKNISK